MSSTDNGFRADWAQKDFYQELGVAKDAPVGFAQIRLRMALGTIANAELDAEINTEPYEQNEECDRDQIESADHCNAERGSHRKPYDQAEEYRPDDLQ